MQEFEKYLEGPTEAEGEEGDYYDEEAEPDEEEQE
jgi:hypothetical protein